MVFMYIHVRTLTLGHQPRKKGDESSTVIPWEKTPWVDESGVYITTTISEQPGLAALAVWIETKQRSLRKGTKGDNYNC
mgnify:CR=1 FL=1